jgi:UDP-glucose 4-epimerase
MHCFVTGAAGFIGSNLVDRLLADGHAVTGYDHGNHRYFLAEALKNHRFRMEKGDALDAFSLMAAMRPADIVFHLAGNADIRHGIEHPSKDLHQNTVATHNVLEAMRVNGIRRIAFSSTGSVYGRTAVNPTPEDAPMPVQTSLYAASKVAAECLIHAYCESFGFQGYIFRYVSILGERYTHGYVFDFCKRLLADPTKLTVMGDGTARKSYLYVQDCIDAMLLAVECAPDKVNTFNLGTDAYAQVKDSVHWITEELGLTPEVIFTEQAVWTGDVDFIYLDCARMRALGWEPKHTIREGVERTARYLWDRQELLRGRA